MKPFCASSKSRLSDNGSALLRISRNLTVYSDGILPFGSKCFVGSALTIAPPPAPKDSVARLKASALIIIKFRIALVMIFYSPLFMLITCQPFSAAR